MNKDWEIQPAATDGISDVMFSPVSDLLSVSSWDGNTRIYEILPNSSGAVLKATITHENNSPALCTTWSDVRLYSSLSLFFRTELRYFQRVLIRPSECWI